MNKLETRNGPVPLTEEHLSAVAGGVLNLTAALVRSPINLPPMGCQACTSGGPIDVLGAIGQVVKY